MALPFQLDNPGGLIALLGLIPLILLYLIRPKPRPMNVPSLMFFMRSSGSKRLNSFLKQITHDWLFLIQLLLLLALLLTFAKPFSTYEHDITASNTVIVIDVSASMQTVENGRTRFDLAKSQAKKVLGAKNSIILAKDTPYLALQDATGDETVRYLNSLQPRATPSNIGEAVILAGEALGGEGRVIVISDFLNTGGQDPEVAKSVLETRNIVVDFINVAGGKKNNVGIIQLDAENDQTTVYVKNFQAAEKKVPLTVGSKKTTLTISPGAIETFVFKTPPGVTKLELGVQDDLQIDNIAYLSAPEAGKAKALLVTNNKSVFLKNALLASGDFDVTITEPPVIPEGDFDVIVVTGVDREQILPGTFEDMLKQVEKGSTAIIAYQNDRPDYKGLLPVTLNGRVDGGIVSVDQLNRFTKNIDFGSVISVPKAETKGDQAVIASVRDIPLITIKPEGSGKLVYYGVPQDADFKYSPHFPIFWTELLKFVTQAQDVQNLNYKTGETLLLDSEQKIKTPTRTIRRAALVLDEAGVYELEDRNVAVNLVDELESNINLEKPKGTKSTDYELHPVTETRKLSWSLYLIMLALFFVVFEIFFIKYRGDL